MARSKTAGSATTDMLKGMQKLFAPYPMVGPQVEHFWQAQDAILNDAETFARNWFERRHTATRTALNAAKDVTKLDNADPAAAMKVMSDWQSHSMERIAEDVQEWMDLCTRCSAHITQAQMEAGEEGLQAARKKKDSAPA